MNRALMYVALLTLSAAATACGDDTTGGGAGGGGDVDATCESDDDCKEGLECDDHDDESTCQEPHSD